jgi:hypothetical protein
MKKIAVELAVSLTLVVIAIIQIDRFDKWSK